MEIHWRQIQYIHYAYTAEMVFNSHTYFINKYLHAFICNNKHFFECISRIVNVDHETVNQLDRKLSSGQTPCDPNRISGLDNGWVIFSHHPTDTAFLELNVRVEWIWLHVSVCFCSRLIKNDMELEVLRYTNRISSEAHKMVRSFFLDKTLT